MTTGSSATPNIDRVVDTPQHADGLYFTTVDVVGAVDLSPGMRRVTFGGAGLAEFHMPRANVAVRLFFPEGDRRLDVLTPQTNAPSAARQLRRRARVYTARTFDPTGPTITIDFVLHGDGLASGWAATARRGDRLILSGPRAHAVPPPDAEFVLFGADQTALPALEAILESLSPDTRGLAIVSAPGAVEQRHLDVPDGVAVRWIDSSAGERLADAVEVWWRSAPDLGESPAAWLAGELEETRAARDYLLDYVRISRDRVSSFPYWRRGSDATTLDEARAATAVRAREAGRDLASVDDFELVQ